MRKTQNRQLFQIHTSDRTNYLTSSDLNPQKSLPKREAQLIWSQASKSPVNWGTRVATNLTKEWSAEAGQGNGCLNSHVSRSTRTRPASRAARTQNPQSLWLPCWQGLVTPSLKTVGPLAIQASPSGSQTPATSARKIPDSGEPEIP